MRKNAKYSGLLALLMVLGLLLSACGNASQTTTNDKKEAVATEDGPYTIGQGRVVPSVDPIDNAWQLTAHGVSEYVYMQNEEGELTSRFVDTLEATDPLTWKATLKEAQFSNGDPVDAKAIADAMNEIQEKNPLARATAGKMVFTPEGEKNLTIVTERPVKNMAAVLCEWTNVVFKRSGDDVIYTGPYMVKNLNPEHEIAMTPNPHYPDAEKRHDVTVRAFQDEASMKAAFDAGQLDMMFPITPDLKGQVEKEGKKTQTIDAGYQYFLMTNLQKGPMADPAFREALDLGLNREDYVKALKGGSVPTGVFAHYYPFAGDVKLTYDKEKAEQLLDRLGYVKGQDGMRTKDGKPLTLSVATLSFRKDLVILGQVLASQLKELGIEAQVDALDNAENVDANSGYDLLFYSQHTAPTGEPSYFLSQFFRTGEAKNKFGYASAEMDKILDEFGTSDDANAVAKKAQDLIAKDRPVLLVIDPQWHAAVSDRLSDYKPYCGDYYVVNANLGL